MRTTRRPSRRNFPSVSPMVRGLALLTIGVFGMGRAGSSQPASLVQRLDNGALGPRARAAGPGPVTAVRSGEKSREAVVAVECSLKGAPGKEVIVVFSPGQSDSPVFEPGEVVLLFLTEAGPGRFQTTGGEQGKFTLAHDRGPGRR